MATSLYLSVCVMPLARFSFESDVTDSAFNMMDIQPRVCREKAVCEAEILAGESYVFGSVMKLTRRVTGRAALVGCYWAI